jgi:serine/threonine protein kinase
MPHERRDLISDLYHRALARAPEERAAFLIEACHGDEALREEVESLLEFEPASSRLLERPAVAVAGVATGAVSMIDRRLGPYTIVAPLGAGGMGEVYRARDSKLGRDVAVKILPSHFTADPERRARFAREARTLATLNHPHIGAIYGLEEADGVSALVLELVEGQTLADRLERGALPIPQALAIARQVAEALEAAHEKGIVHRDLKPANIVLQGALDGLSSDVRAKVLDFGLAKPMAIDLAADPTAPASGSFGGTADGRIVGTPAYMSPEQARGLTVDKRTDIWAFGCVLFEMLTVRRAFTGDSLSDTVARVLEREPDWTQLPAATPAAVRTLLQRCLRKDPRRRLRDIADALIEIDDLSTPAGSDAAVPGRVGQAARRSLPWILAAAIAGTGWVAWWNRVAPPAPPEVVETALNAPDNSRFTALQVAVSPDGRHIAFVATSKTKVGSSLWVRSLSAFEPQELADTHGARSPFWSPDSSTIGYFQESSLKTVPVSGGSPFTVTTAGPAAEHSEASGGTWSRDGVIVFGPLPDGALYSVTAKSGTPTRVTVPKSVRPGDRWPWFLDDGQHFLYLAGDTAFELRTGSLTSTTPAEIIGPSESHAAYAAGYLFFARGGNLMAQRFDPIDRKVLGEPIDLGRRTGIEPHNQRGMFAVSLAGPLLYRAGARTRSQLTWIDRDGSPRGIVGDVGAYYNLDLSPDERRLAVARMTEQAGRSEFEIWTIELSTGNATRLTDDYPAWQFDPAWSPDGTRLAFNKMPIRPNGRFGLFTLPADGGGGTEVVVPPETSLGVSGVHWSRGDIIVYESGSDKNADLWTIAMSGDRKPTKFRDTRYRESNGTLSPDGRWMAHMSNASGRDEVYVRPFPARDPPVTVSREGGMYPDWRRDGKELFFLAPDGSMMAVGFDPKTGRVQAAPRKLFTTPLRYCCSHPYVVSADGQRFLMPLPLDDPPRMVHDWRALIRR